MVGRSPREHQCNRHENSSSCLKLVEQGRCPAGTGACSAHPNRRARILVSEELRKKRASAQQ